MERWKWKSDWRADIRGDELDGEPPSSCQQANLVLLL